MKCRTNIGYGIFFKKSDYKQMNIKLMIGMPAWRPFILSFLSNKYLYMFIPKHEFLEQVFLLLFWKIL